MFVLILKTEVVKPMLFFFFLRSCLKWNLRSAEGHTFLLSVFRAHCSLLCPGTIWDFCLWDSWRDRVNGKTLTSACGLPSALLRFAENAGGISTFPDLANLSPTLLSVCCSNYQMMRNSLQPASPGSKAASFRQVLAVSQCRAVSPDTNE